MAGEFEIAVQGAAATDQERRRDLVIARRQGQDAGDLHVPVRVLDFLGVVGEGRLRLLRARRRLDLNRFSAEFEREPGQTLGELARDFAAGQRAVEGRLAGHALHRETDRAASAIHADVRQRQAVGALGGDVDRPRPCAVGLGQVHHEDERLARSLDRPFPVALGVDSLGRDRHHGSQHCCECDRHGRLCDPADSGCDHGALLLGSRNRRRARSTSGCRSRTY